MLTKHGYISNIFITGNRIDYEEKIIRELMTANYAGAIIEINKAVLPRANHLIEELSQRMPVILLDGYYPNFPQIPYVSLDDRKGGYRATEYLIQHGHHKIFHVGKVDDLQGLLRYQGYISALAAYHLPFDEDRVFWATDLIFRKCRKRCWIFCLKKFLRVLPYSFTTTTLRPSYPRVAGTRRPHSRRPVGHEL